MAHVKTGGRKFTDWSSRLYSFHLLWFAWYLATGAFALAQGKTSFLAGTADRVDSIWISLFFLNIPLQMVLSAAGMMMSASGGPSGRRAGHVLAVLTSGLIIFHLGISLVCGG